MCAQVLMNAIEHEGVRRHFRESALKVDSGRKIPCHTGESNLPQRHAGPTFYQLCYIPTLQSGRKTNFNPPLSSEVLYLTRMILHSDGQLQ